MPTREATDRPLRRIAWVCVVLALTASALAALVNDDLVRTVLGVVVGACSVLAIFAVIMLWWGHAHPARTASGSATTGAADQEALDALEPLRAARRQTDQ